MKYQYKLYGAIFGDLAGQPYEFPAMRGPYTNINLYNPNSHITDDGTKKSKKGLLRVGYDMTFVKDTDEKEWNIVCADQQTWEEEKQGLLTTVFLDGKLVKQTTLEEIRNKLNN